MLNIQPHYQQMEFIELIINHLTEHGVMDAALLYESPFTDIAAKGPETLFAGDELDFLVSAIQKVRDTALVA